VGHLVQPPCRSRVTYSRLHRTLSRWGWNISREGDSMPGRSSCPGFEELLHPAASPFPLGMGGAPHHPHCMPSGRGCTPLLPSSSSSSSSAPPCPQSCPNRFSRALGLGSGLVGTWVAGLDVQPWRGPQGSVKASVRGGAWCTPEVGRCCCGLGVWRCWTAAP